MIDVVHYDHVCFDEIVGKTLTGIAVHGQDQIDFAFSDGSEYSMLHFADCCEDVYLDDVCGDLDALVGQRVAGAELVTNNGSCTFSNPIGPESYTWTFYKLLTDKEAVTLRWYGSSNGYYSEEVSFVRHRRHEK